MTKSLSKAIALATMVGAAASAQAVTVNPQGLGEVLLYSLYTAEEGNITNINITNTTNQTKAVKVRFVEGQNSQEVLDFNLYLSPRDQWSGAVTATADGAQLITADKSCTAPAIAPLVGVPFKSLDFIGDGGAQSLARTRVGHLEVIEMGTLKEGSALALAVEAGNAPGQAPANCGAIAKAFAPGGIWEDKAGTDYSAGFEPVLANAAPGGLYGSASILNIDGSTQISYDAVAIDDFKLKTLHARPGTIYPTLNGAIAAGVSAVGNTTIAPFGGVGGQPSTEAASTVRAISDALAVSSIHNDFVLDEARGSQTNWVITYPTKRFHVDTNMPDSLAMIAAAPLSRLTPALVAAKAAKVGDTVVVKEVITAVGPTAGNVVDVVYTLDTAGVGAFNNNGSAPAVTITPAALITGLTNAINTAKTNVTTALRPFQNNWVGGKSCDRIAINAWDNEEFVKSNLEFSPSRPGEGSQLCYETNILTFNGTKVLGGEFVTENIELAQPDFQFGWMDIDFLVPAVPGKLAGQKLPAIGFSAVTVKNNFTGNGLANNYGSATSHKATK